MFFLLALIMVARAELFCPAANDLTVAYGSPQIRDRGWTTRGGGGVATKAAFNLLGGYVTFTADFTGTNAGVNANVYTLSPALADPRQGFAQSDYCDGAIAKWCPEVDWIESNGKCGFSTTLHTTAGPGPIGCSAWGCRFESRYKASAAVAVRIEYALDGAYTVYVEGQKITHAMHQPTPKGSDRAIVAEAYRRAGAVIYSSQWVGWVPMEGACPRGGDLPSSVMKVSNLVVSGKVVQGPAPRRCPSCVGDDCPTQKKVCVARWGDCSKQKCCADKCTKFSATYSQCIPINP